MFKITSVECFSYFEKQIKVLTALSLTVCKRPLFPFNFTFVIDPNVRVDNTINSVYI